MSDFYKVKHDKEYPKEFTDRWTHLDSPITARLIGYGMVIALGVLVWFLCSLN